MQREAFDRLAGVDKETTDILRNSGIFVVEKSANLMDMSRKLDDLVELLESELPEADDVAEK